MTELSVVPVAADSAATVSINGEELQTPDAGDAGMVLPLALGVTSVSISVASADGNQSATYSLRVTRQSRPDDWEAVLSIDDFAMACPDTIWEGLEHVCTVPTLEISPRIGLQ